MTPTKTIDRIFPGVGRIKRASGTRDAKTFRAINTALDQLYSQGRLDILRALKTAKRPTPLEVLDAVRSGNLARLASPAVMVTLHDALDRFAKEYPCGDKHRATIRSNVKHIKRVTSKEDTAGVLATAVIAMRSKLSKHERAFNLLKSNMQAFARWHGGERSDMYLEVVAVAPYPKKRKRKPHSCDVAEMLELVGKLNEEGNTSRNNTPVQLPLGDMWWSMCVTGMRPVEYWGAEWQDRGAYVEIVTAKQADGERVTRSVPRLRPIIAAACGRDVFARALRAASDGKVQPYDGRRTFSNWMEKAKVPRTRRRLYMGHGEKDVTDLYEWEEVERYLAEDGELMRDWLAEQISKAEGTATVLPMRQAK